MDIIKIENITRQSFDDMKQKGPFLFGSNLKRRQPARLSTEVRSLKVSKFMLIRKMFNTFQYLLVW